MPLNVTKAKSSFAEEAGRITALVEKKLRTGAPVYPLQRIKQETYETRMGHSPRKVRYETVPPTRAQYQPLLPAGNEAKTFTNPLDGSTISGFGDRLGPGELQGEIIRGGYREFTRCLYGTAVESEIFDVMDILEKHKAAAMLDALRRDMPRYAKEHFASELLAQVVRLSKRKYSMAVGYPTSINSPNFPCVPTGGPDIGTLRRIENVLRHEGWDEGSETPMVHGRPALQVYMGRDAIEFAIINRKRQYALDLNSELRRVDDGTFGQTEAYEGIQFIENPQPERGYIVQTSATTFEFRRISPWTVTAGVEGIVKDVNDSYWSSYINVGGVNYPVVEIGHIIHPMGMVREGMAPIPSFGGKTFKDMFNFQVALVPDYAIQEDSRLNKDGRFIQYRMTHAYAPFSCYPELMTAFVFIAPTPQQYIQAPNGALVTPATELTGLAPFAEPRPLVAPVSITEPLERDATDPTCEGVSQGTATGDLFPTNAAGSIRHAQLAYGPDESAGTVTIYVERIAGSSGAASVAYTTVADSATAGVEYTTTAGTLNWADGVFGIKTFTVPVIVTAGDDTGKAFFVRLSGPTGAILTVGANVDATVTLKDADAA